MATGFGFCSNCGAAATGPGEKFCGVCGAAQPVRAAAGAPVPPPYAPPPYAPQPYAPQPGQPAYGMPPGAVPYGPPRSSVNPLTVILGVLVIVAIVVGGALALGFKGPLASSGSPTPGGSISPSSEPSVNYPGSIVFSPSTINCPSGPNTTTVKLPSSVIETDQITYRIDETEIVTQSVTEFGLTQQPDGTWFVKDTNASGSSDCSMGPGVHTARLLAADGQVLAQGSFTVVMSGTAKPTAKATQEPTPLSEAIGTIEPSSISCSAAAGIQVVATYRLPSSVAATNLLTAVWDDQQMDVGKVSSFFQQQADGTWLATDKYTGSDFCDMFDAGSHRMGYLDYDGNLVVQVTFTVKP